MLLVVVLTYAVICYCIGCRQMQKNNTDDIYPHSIYDTTKTDGYKSCYNNYRSLLRTKKLYILQLYQQIRRHVHSIIPVALFQYGYVIYLTSCTMKSFVIQHDQHELLYVMLNSNFTSYHKLCSCLLIHCDMCYCYQGVYSLRLLFTESIVAGTVDRNQTTEVNTTTTEIPPVELNITECTNHMDCPFYQCCKLKYVHMYYISSL